MKTRIGRVSFLILLAMAVLPIFLSSQGTPADYERAAKLRDKVQFLALDVVDRSGWIGKTTRFWYGKRSRAASNSTVMDAESLAKKPAFDHQKLAAAFSAASGEKYSALRLPFHGARLRERRESPGVRGRGFPVAMRAGGLLRQEARSGLAPPRGRRRIPFAPRTAPPQEPKVSPDGKKEAFIRNYNVWLRSKDTKDEMPLSWEGDARATITCCRPCAGLRIRRRSRPTGSGPATAGSSNMSNPLPRTSSSRNITPTTTPSPAT